MLARYSIRGRVILVDERTSKVQNARAKVILVLENVGTVLYYTGTTYESMNSFLSFPNGPEKRKNKNPSNLIMN